MNGWARRALFAVVVLAGCGGGTDPGPPSAARDAGANVCESPEKVCAKCPSPDCKVTAQDACKSATSVQAGPFCANCHARLGIR